MVKETPIIMSGNHPKLILDGIKTQTRRVVKLPDAPNHLGDWEPTFLGGDGTTRDSRGILVPRIDGIWHTRTGKFIKCPYGQVGDRLWVRETWRVESFMEGEPIMFGYKDGQTKECWDTESPDYESWEERVSIQSTEDAEKAHSKQGDDGVYHWDIGQSPCRWRPSIHMPRWASRITLEITEVRVERLNQISELDAFAEGCRNQVLSDFAPNFDIVVRPASEVFSELWDSLNAKRGYGWEVNPWVGVISFKVIE